MPVLDDLRARWGPRLSWPWRHPVASALVFGTACRVGLFLENRGYWLDELSMRDNFVGRTAANLFATGYTHNQLVPPGYFAAVWVCARLPLNDQAAHRLVSLVGGLVALLAFAALAKLSLPQRAATAAVWWFAVSGDLIVYACELKPYSTDTLAAVVLTLAGVAMADARATPGRLFAFAALGATSVWFAFPSALVLGGVGLSLIGTALSRREWPRSLGLSLVSLAWLTSFAASYRVSQQMLGDGGRHGMAAFWDFAFPPWPPRSLSDALWPVREGLRVFVNPLDFHGPPDTFPWAWAVPAVALFGLGTASLFRRDRPLLATLLLPGALAMAAAHLRLYPFHGRLILFLAPSVWLVTAEGTAAALGPLRARPLQTLLVASLFLFPTLRATNRLIDPHLFDDHNSIGDLRPERDAPGAH